MGAGDTELIDSKAIGRIFAMGDVLEIPCRK